MSTATIKPTVHNCVIAVTRDCDAYLIKSEPSLENIFDGCNLFDNVTENQTIPSKEGIYKCQISYLCYPSHHALDPVEWRAEVKLIKCEEVVVNCTF